MIGGYAVFWEFSQIQKAYSKFGVVQTIEARGFMNYYTFSTGGGETKRNLVECEAEFYKPEFLETMDPIGAIYGPVLNKDGNMEQIIVAGKPIDIAYIRLFCSEKIFSDINEVREDNSDTKYIYIDLWEVKLHADAAYRDGKSLPRNPLSKFYKYEKIPLDPRNRGMNHTGIIKEIRYGIDCRREISSINWREEGLGEGLMRST